MTNTVITIVFYYTLLRRGDLLYGGGTSAYKKFLYLRPYDCHDIAAGIMSYPDSYRRRQFRFVLPFLCFCLRF